MIRITMRMQGKILVDTPGAILFFHQEYQRAMLESLKTLQDMVRARTPIGATGRLYRSISYWLKDLTPGGPQGRPSGPIEFKGAVFSSDVIPPPPSPLWTALALGPTIALSKPAYMVCTYARAVEFGTRPHWPQWEPLRAWVAHKFPVGLTPRKVDLVTWAISRDISKRGTGPRYMFTYAESAFRSQGVLERNVRAAADRAIEAAAVTTPWWAAF